jgi:molecular chaperone DnaK
MGMFVGIDLGTTYSVVAYVTPEGKPEVIPNEFGQHITPSVVYFGESGPIVGDEAKERQSQGATEVASFFKREMSNPYFLLSFQGRDYTTIDLSALVVAYMKAQAERALGQPVTHAVITVPAYFTHTQRQATIQAGQKAGLEVLSILNEPTAAAFAYGLRPSPQKQSLLVYDLGGGTFDVSLIEISATDLTVIGTDGDHSLGGKDWDERLTEYLEQQFQQEFGASLVGDDINELLVQVENLKRTLSARQSAEIRVQGAGRTGTYTVSRKQFEDLSRDLLERTRQLTQKVLDETGRAWTDIDGVIPVGGATRMPMVRALIEQMSGKPPLGGINPDEAVALGAAIAAALEMERLERAKLPEGNQNTAPQYHVLGRKVTRDVIAHSLGMIAENSDRSQYINSILIRKNLPIPSKETRPYRMRVRRDGRQELDVFLTQGETEHPVACAYAGHYIFSDFPSLSSKTAILDITYEYDKNGVVHVSAVEQSTGQRLTMREEPVPADVPERFLGRPTDEQTGDHLTCYLAFDLSGSMTGGPLIEAQSAAEAFVRGCDLTTTSIGLISFSDRARIDQNATQNINEITRAIRQLTIGVTGYGNATDPFTHLYEQLLDAPGLRYGVVLADGVWAHQPTAIKRAQRCHEAGIEIIAIGFGGADRTFLERIASSSEQSFFTDLSHLTETFTTIAQELTGAAGEGTLGSTV